MAMRVKADDLTTLGAYSADIEAFRRAFPDGATSWLEVAKHKECRPKWRSWIAARAPGLALAERLALADTTEDPAHCRGMIAAEAPGLTPAERLALADASDDCVWWRGEIAIFAPGLSLAERLALIERSNAPSYWRRLLATETVASSILDEYADGRD